MGEHEPDSILVVGLGQACVDYLGRVPSYPAEDTKVEMVDLQVQCGGPASTALVALARLGISTAFLGSIANDASGILIRDDLMAEGVDLSGLHLHPEGTSQFAFIAVSKGAGQRTVFWHRGSVPHLTPQDVDLSSFPDARVLHLDGLMIEASLEAAVQARKRGMRVVMDAGTLREGTLDLLRRVDVLIASSTFAQPLTGASATPEASLHRLRECGPADVVITLGDQGSVGLGPDGPIRQPAFPVSALDTTGAGDVYHGAYIYGLLQGWPMGRCMEFASGASAMACRRVGGRRGSPGLSELKAFLKDRQASFF